MLIRVEAVNEDFLVPSFFDNIHLICLRSAYLFGSVAPYENSCILAVSQEIIFVSHLIWYPTIKFNFVSVIYMASNSY